VALNADHTSRGYGFVCFRDEEAAARALSETSRSETFIGVKYEQKSRTDMRKIFNNIFVKNIPDSWQEPQIRAAFEPFGRISSLFLQKNDIGTFAFVCFGSEQEGDREYGPKCAAAAVEAMHGKVIEGKELYVRDAKSKQDRVKELELETLKYKSSKKRCNLYVKNFDPTTTEEDLRNLFVQFGDIESLRLFQQKDNKMPYAFVCFKTPDAASSCKNAAL